MVSVCSDTNFPYSTLASFDFKTTGHFTGSDQKSNESEKRLSEVPYLILYNFV